MKKTTLKVLALSVFPVLFITFQNFSPPPAVTVNPDKFKIIWHLGSAVEPIADASENRLKVLNNVKSLVDGYYILVLNSGSLLTYWTERPIECLINFKNLKWKNEDGAGDAQILLNGKYYNKDTQAECATALLQYQDRLWREAGQKEKFKVFQRNLHENALKRVLTNLNIKGEQAAGKKIMAEMLLRGGDNGDFFYNHKADQLRVVVRDGELSIPESYGFLRNNGIIADRLMTYQEPRPQSINNTLLRVPLVAGGTTDYPVKGGCYFCLPKNLRVIDMVADAFGRANLETPRMAINIRTWNDEYVDSVKKHLKTNPSKFDGINIEGSSNKLEKKSFAASVLGAKWMLENTNKPISLLIPGALLAGETDKEEVRDERYVQNFLNYVTEFNDALNAQLGLPPGKNALCNSRISLIVGSYGAPLHMQTLPLIRRDSKGNKTRAGTSGAEIVALSNLRKRLCN